MNTNARQLIERIIASRIIRAMLDTGFAIDVEDGEETTLERSTDHDSIIEHLFTTDMDYIHAVKDGRRRGWVQLVYGNDGFDVICDYTVNLEDMLAPVNAFADQIERDPLSLLDVLSPGMSTLNKLQDALKKIRHARDYCAEHGTYPPGVACDGQEFDDWAADVADKALQSDTTAAPPPKGTAD